MNIVETETEDDDEHRVGRWGIPAPSLNKLRMNESQFSDKLENDS